MKKTDFDKGEVEANFTMVSLSYTTKIIEENLQLPEWEYLQSFYSKTDSAMKRICVSVMNSIISQRRVYFTMSCRCIRKLVQGDQNHKESIGLSNKTNWYGHCINILCKSGLLELVKRGAGSRPSVYKLTDEYLINVLKLDEEKQRKEAFKFIGETEGGGKEDWENLNKKLGVSDG